MLESLQDLWLFLRNRRKYWLAPVIFVLLLLGILLVTSSGSVLSPFIYSIF